MAELLLLLLLLSLNLINIGICHDDPVQCPVRVYCKKNESNILELPGVPSSVKLPVCRINFKSTTLEVNAVGICLTELFLRLNYSSFYPFQSIGTNFDFAGTSYDHGYSLEPRNITFFRCPSFTEDCRIEVAEDDDGIIDLDLVYCTKLSRQILPIPATFIRDSSFYLVWSKTNLGSGCFVGCNISNKEVTQSNKGTQTNYYESTLLPVTGTVILWFIPIALYSIYCYHRDKGEDQQRVENFLKDYQALNPTRFSHADIKRITRQFKDKLGEGAHGIIYKGKLSNQILVAVKILTTTEGDGKEFINEVGTMAKIHHVNVVRLLGYCADGSHRALVYHFFPKGNLQSFISLPSNKESFLGWNKMHRIALGIAKGIEYLHQGCDQRILHFDINPRNVLLDESFTPKISDFGLAKLCRKSRSTVSMTAARGTLGYMAPEVFSRNFGNVSYKSDIYSYGMLLLEMVGGRKNTNASEETFQVLYPNWIHSLLEGDDTYIPIDDDGDFRIAKKLAIVGLWCIQWHPVHRPSMKSVVQMLEGGEEQLKVPPNPFESAAASSSSAIIPARCLNLELEVIPETD
ncbi:hypothetical protein PIB30_048488 [Stylosanthes scabra]|uniref:Protein kinase domain-containing protein n=1 Tax=Stylosanthes scabra TaxID=79078 RepID=A0ABU6RH89_9FABA|nr:hypothetical protein [Stylosanthes scabra]